MDFGSFAFDVGPIVGLMASGWVVGLVAGGLVALLFSAVTRH